MSFVQNYEQFYEEFLSVCDECGRDPRFIKILPISKTVEVGIIREAISYGFHEFGENRPDVLLEKRNALPHENWHFIGNIQSRRIPDIVSCSELIHSLYKVEHVVKIDEAAKKLGKTQKILVELSLAGETQKGGILPVELPEMINQIKQCEHICLCGFMTMAPWGDAWRARKTFEEAKTLFDEVKQDLDDTMKRSFNEISMGMSDDWPEAVRSGATILRIGRTLFS